jgi:hypothetical protein
MRWAVHVVHIEEMRNAYRMLDGKPEGQRQLRSPECKSGDNIKIDLKEIVSLHCKQVA